MSTVLFFGGTICMGLTLSVLLLFMLVSRIEGAKSPGDGTILFLLGSGPLGLGILLYLLAWRLSTSVAVFG